MNVSIFTRLITIVSFMAIPFLNRAPSTVHSRYFVEGNNLKVSDKTAHFGLDLFKRINAEQRGSLKKNNDSILLSPQSIWSALLLIYLGTNNNTARELENVLGVDSRCEAIRIMDYLENGNFQRNKRYPNTFLKSEMIYFDERSIVRPDIKECILRKRAKFVNFAQSEKTSKEINDFVSNATLGTINEIVDAETIADADLVLINAIHFKGIWQYKFHPDATYKGKFFKDGNDDDSSSSHAAIVDFMKTKRKFYYGNYDSRAHLLEIPYTADGLFMYILLPFNSGDDELDNVVKALNACDLRREMDNMFSRDVELTLPKFKLDTTLPGDELIPVLEQMGIKDLFKNASFGFFFNYSESNNIIPKNINNVIHKAHMKVSEEGTEASAATALISGRSMEIPGELIHMYCNRPFIFYIFDKMMDKMLFIGIFRN